MFKKPDCRPWFYHIIVHCACVATDLIKYITMGLSLYSLLEAALLCVNAICILHEERFLAKSRYYIETYSSQMMFQCVQ